MLPQEGCDVVADDGRKGGLAPADAEASSPLRPGGRSSLPMSADLASVNLFTVPTARLRVLFVFVVLSHYRRGGIHFNVTEQPTAH
jgi:hypothetical protein